MSVYVRHSSRPASRVVRGESSAKRVLEQSRMRLMCVCMVFSLSFAMLALRLIEVSLMGGGDLPFHKLVSHPELLLQAEEKVAELVQPEVIRREITDRNGMVLATSVETASLAANPQLIRRPGEVAQKLAGALPELSVKILREKLSQENRFVYIKRHLNPAEQHRVNALGIPGLFFEPDQRRIYPYGELMAHVLGYVGVDNQGLAGIEKSQDKTLLSPLSEQDDLALSVDLRVQSILYDELQASMNKFSAIGAAGVVADIQTGEVLGMVSLPSFDPHDPGTANASAKFNRVSLGTYEMGSVFKTFTMAMGFHTNAITMRDGYDITKPIRVGGFTIRDYHPLDGWRNVREIFAQSSNIGTVKVAMDVGATKQKDFLRRLGMMHPVEIELPEVASPMVPKKWRQVNAMTISYGHGISVTPLHVVRAMAAVTGNGKLPQMTLLKSDNEQALGEPVVGQHTVRNTRRLLRDVVQYGTAKKASVAGYRVGGKTGTAEKIVNGRYKDDAKITSLVSVFPVDEPRYVVLTMVDEPKGIKETFGYATGGWVAAPTAGNIISRIGPLLGVRPVYEIQEKEDVPQWAHAYLPKRQAPVPAFWRRNGVRHAAY